ncbi:MAG: hypothetical protein IKC17_02975 [Bacteroidales bacterium]|nr:hypothetical protein [Bacteroidales bacterium]
MAETFVKGKEIIIQRPPMMIYSMFADLSRFTLGLPEEYRDKVTADADSINIDYNGMKLGFVVEQRVPFSKIVLKDNGLSPFPFSFSFNMTGVGIDSTLFHIELTAQLNMMMKMFIGGKLQEIVDKITEQIEKAASGQMTDIPNMPDMTNFS